ncbi:MAG: phage transcriptional regulator, RinA family [Caproiciproducens sp.]|nr:phage transcriptional regulator, RinA family [Caproiciproducens sp.]
MKREIRSFIESELRDYDNTKKEWENLQEELTIGNAAAHEDYMVRLGLLSPEKANGPTESRALKLVSNKRLAQTERTIKAIEKVIMNLPEEKFKLIRMRYWDMPRTLTDDGIAAELSCSRTTLYVWVDGIITALAKEMGLID